jgi:hypothetical protein
MTMRLPTPALDQHHRGDSCLRLLPARRLLLPTDTIMRTIELGVMITDARCRREADDDLLQPGGPRRLVSGRRPGGPLPRH